MSNDSDDAVRADTSHWGLQKVYFVCLTEPTRGLEPLGEYLEEHKQWLVGLEREGKIFAAGPLLDDDYRFHGPGMIVLRAGSLSEAKAMCDADPFHANGVRSYRLVPWQVNEGSLGLRLTFADSSFALD